MVLNTGTHLKLFRVLSSRPGSLFAFILLTKQVLIFFFFFFLNHQFITRGAEAGRGKYTVPT